MKNLIIIILFCAPLSIWGQKTILPKNKPCDHVQNERTFIDLPNRSNGKMESTYTCSVCGTRWCPNCDDSNAFKLHQASNGSIFIYPVNDGKVETLNYSDIDTIQKLNKRIEDLENKLEVAKFGQQMGDESWDRMLRAMYRIIPTMTIDKILDKYYEIWKNEKK